MLCVCVASLCFSALVFAVVILTGAAVVCDFVLACSAIMVRGFGRVCGGIWENCSGIGTQIDTP